MKQIYTDYNLTAIFLMSVLTIVLLLVLSGAAYPKTHYPATSRDLWTESHRRENAKELIQHLRNIGLAPTDMQVSDEEMELYITMVLQFCSTYDNVDPALILAQIGTESDFRKDCVYQGAVGLMQIIPKYHYGRMTNLFCPDNVLDSSIDIKDPRVNIAVGIDYMSYILEETGGDEVFALMWYNQGPLSADEDYSKGYISNYARTILKDRDSIAPYIKKEGGGFYFLN